MTPTTIDLTNGSTTIIIDVAKSNTIKHDDAWSVGFLVMLIFILTMVIFLVVSLCYYFSEEFSKCNLKNIFNFHNDTNNIESNANTNTNSNSNYQQVTEDNSPNGQVTENNNNNNNNAVAATGGVDDNQRDQIPTPSQDTPTKERSVDLSIRPRKLNSDDKSGKSSGSIDMGYFPASIVDGPNAGQVSKDGQDAAGVRLSPILAQVT